MSLTSAQCLELSTVVSDRSVDAVVASRARMVLWRDEGYSADEVAALAGVSRPTVNTWVRRYAQAGLDGLVDRPKPGKPAQVPGQVRARILALTRSTPPSSTGLSHWSSREMARYLKAHEGIDVSHNFVADLWRKNGLQPHRTATFKVPLSTCLLPDERPGGGKQQARHYGAKVSCPAVGDDRFNLCPTPFRRA